MLRFFIYSQIFMLSNIYIKSLINFVIFFTIFNFKRRNIETFNDIEDVLRMYDLHK